jgi:hypothetical protein
MQPLVLGMAHQPQPSSYKCSYAHTTLCITLKGTEVMGTGKKAIYNKYELVLVATTPYIPTACLTARGPRIIYEQRRLKHDLWLKLFASESR